jgi:Flp pilus assembly protein TadD
MRAGGGVPATTPFPAPLGSAEVPDVQLADFVGAESCAGCHAAQYGQWRASVHGRAGGAPSADVVIAPFDGTPIRFKDAIVTPAVRNGEYVFAIAQNGRPTQTYRVDGVIGGGHMVGGGTQGFVTRWGDGTVRFLPFDFAKQENAWFCNTGTRANHGWVLITRDMALADCGDWPPQRVLGDEPRFANCQSCHGSQITVAFDTTKHAYQTGWKSLSVNCESCHGPGRKHVELARSGKIASSADIGMRSLGTLDKDASLGVCFQCHALKDQLKTGYLPGASLASYYSVKMPLLGDRPFVPDGRVRTFAYQQGHLYSGCYRNGSMTCASCHDPHAQSYRDVNGRSLVGRSDDRQCTSCHASKAEPIQAHTRHAPSSAGSRCVNCHMPYQQQQELGTGVRYARSDHTIAIPRPGFDEQAGIQSACAQCHTDRSAAVLARQVTEWYGELKPLPSAVQGLIDAERSGDAARAMELAPNSDNHTIGEFAVLARVVETSLVPDMPSLSRAMAERMTVWARSTDLDMRALALAALHYARGGDSKVRAFLAQQLGVLGADDLAVRRRWVLVLGYLGDTFRAKGDHASAIVTYRKALEVLPGDAVVLTNLGLAYTDAGDFVAAIEALRRSVAIKPSQPLTLVNLGIALESTGDIPGASAAYERAIAIDPREAVAYLNLGNIAFNRDDAARAVALYTRAAAYDPGRAPVFFNLARAYYKLNDLRKALDAVRRGLEIDPANAEGRQMAAQLEQVVTR